MRSPITWFGGKGSMTAKLLPFVPPHHTYCEPFGGGASLLFAKDPAPVEVYNDLDEGLVHFFRTLRNRRHAAELRRRCLLTPYSRAEYHRCRATWRDCRGPIERAYRWYVCARCSFGGRFSASWSYARTHSVRGKAEPVSTWQGAVAGLRAACDRLLDVQIERADFRRIFASYDSPATLFYVDPPYVHSTRTDKRYACELSDADHADLVALLRKLEGMVLLSGYRNGLYRPLERAGWRRKDWRTASAAAGRTRATGILGPGAATKKQPRIESVWISPAAAAALKNVGGRVRETHQPER